ncbi:hypothetical protein B0J17DRAFT_232161 [Rhizoctonia solani]|nr:hypothetical protein B0J17DRAFT_232161 [Rhizoctonia solani]
MTNHSVIRPSTNKKNFKNGISTFNSLQAGLLLLHGNKDISSMLGKVNTVIYWGASPGLNFWNAFKATHTYVLLSNLDDSTARTQATRLNGIHEYPQSVQLNATGPGSPLHLYRDRTRGVMETLPATTTNKIYAGQVVSGPRKSRKDVVIRANYFAARVLLHGKPGDGSLLYPPIGPRPSMKSTQVSSGALQSYVKEGLIRVG